MQFLRKTVHFLSNMKFMGRHSWRFARRIYPHIVLQAILQTIQPFVLLYSSKYILDELAGQRRFDVTMRYLGIYAAAMVIFHIVPTLIQRSKGVQTLIVNQKTTMYNQTKWLYMDYGNFEDGRVRDLSETDEHKLREYIDHHLKVEGDLRRNVALDIKRLVEVQCYRGVRHRKGLPVRGQRTKTNARTRKGPKRTVANKKK